MAEYADAFGGDDPPPPVAGARQIVGGVALLVLGSQWLVGSASDIAESFGVSDLVVGLTVVAIGTSAPELATSIVAALAASATSPWGTWSARTSSTCCRCWA